jgi:hypothetical protein
VIRDTYKHIEPGNKTNVSQISDFTWRTRVVSRHAAARSAREPARHDMAAVTTARAKTRAIAPSPER